jgi:IS4 transposase
MKAENARLLQSIADYKSKGDMAKETVQNLSSVIRDKDLEIDGLKSRNESLVILVQESSKQQSTDTTASVNQETKKSVMDNTNEILILKNKISDLEQKLSLAEVRQSYRRRFNSESQDSKMEQILVNGKDIKDMYWLTHMPRVGFQGVA